MIGLPLIVSQNAFAGHDHGKQRSNHNHRSTQKPAVYSNHYHGHRYVHRVARPHVIHRHVHYRPYVNSFGYPIAHYHYGFYQPCYEAFHTTGVYWSVNVGSGGLGIGIQTGW
jgi:hypothetical protein